MCHFKFCGHCDSLRLGTLQSQARRLGANRVAVQVPRRELECLRGLTGENTLSVNSPAEREIGPIPFPPGF